MPVGGERLRPSTASSTRFLLVDQLKSVAPLYDTATSDYLRSRLQYLNETAVLRHMKLRQDEAAEFERLILHPLRELRREWWYLRYQQGLQARADLECQRVELANQLSEQEDEARLAVYESWLSDFTPIFKRDETRRLEQEAVESLKRSKEESLRKAAEDAASGTLAFMELSDALQREERRLRAALGQEETNERSALDVELTQQRGVAESNDLMARQEMFFKHVLEAKRFNDDEGRARQLLSSRETVERDRIRLQYESKATERFWLMQLSFQSRWNEQLKL
jgi:hypothetical protein